MRKILAMTLIFSMSAVVVQAQFSTTPALSLQPAGDQPKLEGTWLLAEIGGEKNPPPDFFDKLKAKLIFKNDGYEQNVEDKKIEAGKFKVDLSKSPATIEFDIEEGKDAGKKQLGIFKVDGDRVTFAIAKVGSEVRPKNFEPTEDVEVTIFKRSK